MLSDAPLCNFSTLLAAVHGVAVHHGHKTKGWPAIAVRDCKLKFLKSGATATTKLARPTEIKVESQLGQNDSVR